MRKNILLIFLITFIVCLLSACGLTEKNNNGTLTIEEERLYDDSKDNIQKQELVELELARLELELLEYEDKLLLLNVAKESYEENMEVAKLLKPDSYESDRKYRESKAELTLLMPEIEQIQSVIDNIKIKMSKLKDAYGIVDKESIDISIQENKQENVIINNPTAVNIDYFKDYDNTTLSGTSVRAAFQNFFGKPIAILVHTNHMDSKEAEMVRYSYSEDYRESKYINGLWFENYNAIFDERIYADLNDNIILITDIPYFVEYQYNSANGYQMGPGHEDSTNFHYFPHTAKFSSSLIKTENGEVYGIMFIEKTE